MDLGLKEKVALVTGGSEGIGRAAALLLAREGARVAICARREKVLERAAEEVRQATGGDMLAVAADVSTPDGCSRFVRTAANHFGGIDVMVNNAGRSAAQAFDTVSEEEWQEDLDLKLFSAIRCSREAIPYMRQRGGGRIINVTNTPGRAPGPSSVPTSVSRAAGIALTKAMSRDLATDNILVNSVCIGRIKSAQWERRWQERRRQEPDLTLDQYYAELGRSLPLGRVGEAEEAANLIVFLASAAAGYITGTAVNMDGGLSPVV